MSGETDKQAHDVSKDVEKAMQDKNHGGADKAYQILLKESLQTTKGMSAADQQAYYATLNHDLEEKGLLGVMSLEYAQQNAERIGQPTYGGDIVVNQASVAHDQAEAQFYGQDGNPNAAFAAAMDGNLVDAFKRAANGDKTFLGDNGAYGLTPDQIKSQLGDATNDYKQEQQKIGMRSDYPSLLSGQGGKPSVLFNVLDTAENGGNPDGKISQGDLKAYIDHANQILRDTGHKDGEFQYLPKDYNPNDPTSIYNQEFIKEVQGLQKNWNTFKNGHFGLWFWQSDYITKDSLSRAFGYGGTDGGDIWSGK